MSNHFIATTTLLSKLLLYLLLLHHFLALHQHLLQLWRHWLATLLRHPLLWRLPTLFLLQCLHKRHDIGVHLRCSRRRRHILRSRRRRGGLTLWRHLLHRRLPLLHSLRLLRLHKCLNHLRCNLRWHFIRRDHHVFPPVLLGDTIPFRVIDAIKEHKKFAIAVPVAVPARLVESV